MRHIGKEGCLDLIGFNGFTSFSLGIKNVTHGMYQRSKYHKIKPDNHPYTAKSLNMYVDKKYLKDRAYDKTRNTYGNPLILINISLPVITDYAYYDRKCRNDHNCIIIGKSHLKGVYIGKMQRGNNHFIRYKCQHHPVVLLLISVLLHFIDISDKRNGQYRCQHIAYDAVYIYIAENKLIHVRIRDYPKGSRKHTKAQQPQCLRIELIYPSYGKSRYTCHNGYSQHQDCHGELDQIS